tara:strand:+ start:130975 stop:132081 length:1107 start_codon:yes stop_codon:yes gene_type:complete
MSKKGVYFYGLDAYRGLAAILVIIGHTELIKNFNSLKNFFEEGPFIFHLGEIAVTFFFVLSGFLITYLILEEENKTGRLNVRKFYLRRLLRIWPVYYLMLFIGFFVFPYSWDFFNFWPQEISDNNFSSAFLYYLFFLPNVSTVSNPVGFQSWSIGVEEQFYLFWPVIFYFILSKRYRFVILIIIYLALPIIKISPKFLDYEFLSTLKNFFVRARFENMALGGLAALLFYKNWVANKKKLMAFGIVILIFFLIFEIELPLNLETIIYPLLFVNLILFTIINSSSKGFLEAKPFKYLGKISYGLYMYHLIPIYILINFFYPDGRLFSNVFINQVLFHLSVLALTIMVSSLSYHFMEKPLLKYKNKFNRIE